MKNTLKILSLAVVAVAVSACGSCPKGSDYEQAPYTKEGTAGTGLFVYDKCGKAVKKVETRKADTVFQTKVSK